MKCPYCNVDMLEGYLNCGVAIWSTRKHKISMLPGGNEQYALHLGTPIVSPNQVPSHCCPKCKRIIIDSTEYENNIEDK